MVFGEGVVARRRPREGVGDRGDLAGVPGHATSAGSLGAPVARTVATPSELPLVEGEGQGVAGPAEPVA